MRKTLVLISTAALAVALLAGPGLQASATVSGDTLVTTGSPRSPFSENKQNEPAVAINQDHPNILAAGLQRRDRYGGVQRR